MTSRFLRRNVAGVIIAVGLLSGCGHQTSFAEQCQANGFEPGTALFLDCINSRQQAMLQFVGQMRQQQQHDYQQQMQFYQRPVYQNPTINCSSNRAGNFVSTTCN
jgi:hypothetical protein